MASATDPELERRLREDKIAWLTTVGSDGTPEPVPVWFLWQDRRLLVYSQPDARKIRNIARNPRVSIHLNSDLWGNRVVVIRGTASVDLHATPAHEVPAYLEKYREGIAQIEMTPEGMAREYSAAIRVTPLRIRCE
jgi:PPOX class probable F420-dependent enzyme